MINFAHRGVPIECRSCCVLNTNVFFVSLLKCSLFSRLSVDGSAYGVDHTESYRVSNLSFLSLVQGGGNQEALIMA